MNTSKTYQLSFALLGGPLVAMFLVFLFSHDPSAFLRNHDLFVTVISVACSILIYRMSGVVFREVEQDAVNRSSKDTFALNGEDRVTSSRQLPSWREESERIAGGDVEVMVEPQEKVVIPCPKCFGKLRIPANRLIVVTCGHCREKFTHKADSA